MTLGNPAGLLLLALAVPVLLLHVLRPRRPRAAVPSTFLWRDAGAPTTAASPWQKLRWSVPLVLQLLAVAVLAGAAARPARVESVALARHSVFVIDASGSMLARDGDPDRLTDARGRARSLRNRLPDGGVASIVEAGPTPRVLLTASPDRDEFASALRRLTATASRPDLPAAFSLAESLETPGTPLGVVFVSDGALTTDEQATLPPGTRYEKVGSRAANRAVTSLLVEPRGSGIHATVTVRNAAGPAVQQRLRVDVDGRTAATLDLDLPPGATATRELDVPAGDRVEASLEGDDLLAADNRAVAVGGRRPPLRVLLAGPDDPFLERLLAAIPGVTVERRPDAAPAGGFDLAIYDRVDPPAAPGAPFWTIAPPGGVPGIKAAGIVEQPAITLVRSDLPLLEGLDVADVAIAAAQRLEPAPGIEVLIAAEGAPLLLRGELGGAPFAYLAFALGDSNLPLKLAFPLLADRLLTDLVGGTTAAGALKVGQPLPVPAGVAVEVDGPRGQRQLAAGDPVPVADRPGFWAITPAGGARRLVAVNADPAEADPTPRDSLPVRTREGGPSGTGGKGQRSLLPWVVAFAVVLLGTELVVARREGGVRRTRWRAALAVRAVMVAALVAAALGASIPGGGGGVATMFVVDGSGSLGQGGRADAIDFARASLAAQPTSARAGVVVFGGEARLELTVGPAGRFTGQTVSVDRGRTDLAAALRLAGAVLPSDRRRRIVVISDGRSTDGDARAEAERLAIAGIAIDTHTLAAALGPDAAVARVDAPRRARAGERVTVRVTVAATAPGPAEVVLRRDDVEVDRREVDLITGETRVDLTDIAPESGVARYEVQVRSATDTVREDDVGFASMEVEAPARVLLVEGKLGESAPLAGALRAGGLGVDVVEAGGLPPVDRLSGYQATVLVNVPAEQMAPEQVAVLGVAVRDLGRGLLVIGGDRSYGVGGYLGSELEGLLPVTSEVLDPKRRSSVAEVLAIDSSGSMTACHCRDRDMSGPGALSEGGVVKIDIAKAGAEKAIQALQADDQVGIIDFTTNARTVLDVQPRPDADTVRQSLAAVTPRGSTNIVVGLQAAAKELKATKAQLRHIILFTDGFTAPGELTVARDLAASLYAEGITVSVLATGETAAGDDLKAVADAGHGRFYPGRDLQEIPKILAEEAVLASRSLIVEGEEVPRVVGALAPLRDLRSAPPLLGHVATTARPQAEVGLRVGPEDDPLFATWQPGLGRASAWTSDIGTRWAAPWTGWDGSIAFWTALVKDTFGSDNEALATTATVAGERLRIAVEAAADLPPGATARARIAGPSGERIDVALERTEKGFAGEAPATAAGTYAVGVEVAAGAASGTARALATQSYPPEYRPGAPDRALLTRLAESSGGRVDVAPERTFDAAGLRTGRVRHPLAGYLLLLAALLWPLEVAIRRLSRRRELIVPAPPKRTSANVSARPVAAAPPPPPPPPPAPEPEPEPDTTLSTLLRSTRKKRGGDG
jgi:Mg-chelatase subunit ChlD